MTDSAHYTVLVVDDEPMILTSLQRVLRHKFDVLLANSGQQALELLRSHDVHVLITDERMPGMTGVELLTRSKQEFPATVRLLLTGYANLPSLVAAVNAGEIYCYLAKPWDADELLATIEKASAKRRLLDENHRLTQDLLAANAELRQRLAEQQHIEAALRKSEQRFQILAEVAPVGIFRTDAQGSTEYVNPRWCEISELSCAEAMGDGWLRAVHPDDREALAATWRQAALAQTPSRAEYRFLHGDGAIAWVIGQAVPQREANGAISGYIGTITEITDIKRAEEDRTLRALELAALNALGRQVSRTLSVSEVVADAVAEIVKAVQPDLAFVFLREGELLLLKGISPASAGDTFEGVSEHRVGECMCGLAVREGKALFTRDIYSDMRCTWQECKRAGLRSFAALPLHAGEDIIGVIGLAARGERDFEPQAAFLETLASQTAGGIRNALLYEQAGHRFAELVAVHQAGQRLRNLTAPEQVAQEIIGVLESVVGYDYGAVLLIGEGADRLLPFALSEQSRGPLFLAADLQYVASQAPRLGEGITGWVAQTGQSVRLGDVRQDARYRAVRPDIRSELCVPLSVGEKTIGVVNVETTRPNAYTEADQRVLETVAAQIGIAIENARLLAEVQQRAAHQTALNTIITAATRAGSDLDALLATALELALQALGLEVGAVWLLSTPQEPQHVALRGIPAEMSATMGQTAVAQQYDIAATVVVDDWRGRPAMFGQALTSLGISASLTVPLLAEERRIGGLSLASTRPRTWTPEEVAFAETVGRQLGAAADRARLFQETQRRARELAALYDTALALSGMLDTDALLTGLHEQVHRLIAEDGFMVARYEADTEEYEIALAVEEGRRMPELKGVRTPLQGGGLTGWVLRNRQTLLAGDLENEPAPVSPIIDGRPMRSWLGVPLVAHNRLIGAVSVQAFQPHAFSEDDRRLLESLAAPVAIALENARLYEAVRSYTTDLEEKVATRTAELTQREAALRVANEQLEHLSRLKSEFVSNVSHELRTPLTNIITYLWLLDRGKPEKRTQYMATLHRESELLKSLIEDLLHLSRLDLGKVQLALAPVDISQMVERLVGDRATLFADRGLTLEARIEPALPLLQADEKMLIQVLTNLMTNAMNYTPSGGIVMVSAGLQIADYRLRIDNLQWVTFSVSDTGLGISDEDRARLFERFYRGEAARQTAAPGTGLGLAICQELVGRHGGKLTLESQLGLGSTFTVWLPVSSAGGQRPLGSARP